MDSASATSEEQVGSASGPSPSSIQLTRLFANLGEKPTISFFDHPAMVSSLAPTFNSTGNFWTYSLTTPSGALIPMSIAGRDIHILGCTTPLRRLPLYIEKYIDTSRYFNVLHDTQSGTDIPVSPSANPELRTDACASNIEVLILNATHFILTQSAFTQASQLVTFVDPSLSSFLDILPMGNGTLVLTSSGTYYLPAAPEAPTIVSTTGLPTSITHVHSTANCDYLAGPYGEISALNYVVFAWDDSPSSSYYVSLDDGLTFTQHTIGIASSSDAGWVVLGATLSHSYSRYIFAVRDSGDGTGTLLLYDYKYSTWSKGASLPAYLVNEDLSFEIPVNGAGTLYLWVDLGDAQELYYSADGGTTLFPTPPNSLSTSTLQSFDTSFFGSFAILAVNDTTQTLVLGLADVLVYSPPTPPATTAIQVDFDPFGDPRVLALTTKGVTSTSSPLTSLTSSITCPFLHMETNSTTQLHYIDIGESFALTVTLVSAATQDAYVTTRDAGQAAVSVGVSDTSLLDFTLTFFGSSPYTPPITFTQELVVTEHAAEYASYTERALLATGATDVRITAKEYNAQCSFTQFIHKVRVGCPPKRRIVALAEGQACASKEGKCAVSIYYGQELKPTLMLYDDYTLTEGVEVQADFVVWEAYGRKDYSFSQTVKQAGCVSNPQKRSEFKETKLPDGTINYDWTPATYRSCLIPGGGSVKSGGYQVLNARTINSIVFNGGGTYVFRARVVATDFSYCDLTTDIVVDVFGAPLSTGYSALVVLLTSLVIALALLVSYYYYRNNEKLHAE